MEERNIPSPAQRAQELHQRTRTFGKFETEQRLIVNLARAPADHVPNVRFRQLVVGETVTSIAASLEVARDCRRLVVVSRLDADENVRLLARGEAVVELGDVGLPDRGTEIE